jgi:hypothetical protein
MASLTTRTRAKLDEIIASHWETTQLRRWIFDGARDACRRAECLRDTVAFAATAGTQTYSLSGTGKEELESLIRIHRVTYKQVGQTEHYPLDYFDANSLDSMSWATANRNRPVMYTTWGFPPAVDITLYPNPSDAGTVTIYYYRLPSDACLTDAEENVEIPQGWEELCVDYATFQAMLQDGDSRWQAYKAIYDEHLADLMLTAIRFNDQAGMMNVGSFGAVPQWLWDEGWVD